MRRGFEAIDSVVRKVDLGRRDPEFSEEVKRRRLKSKKVIQCDDDVLREFAKLIAFSQNASSKAVSDMIERGILEDAFMGFRVEMVADMQPATVVDRHWNRLGVIRFKKKIASIIRCAGTLMSLRSTHGSFLTLLTKAGIPKDLRSKGDVSRFWQGFDYLRSALEERRMPFFQRTTSLLHFLMTIGYDCVKPDLVVMRVAVKLGIVPSARGTKNLHRAVEFLQLYSLDRGTKPAVVDFYLLVFGGQLWARQYVNASFYDRN